MTKPLVLASSSAYRRALVERLVPNCLYRAPNVDESALPGEPLPSLCRRLAEQKARALADNWPQALIIGSDQSAAVAGTQLHKPGNFATAHRQLRALSGREVTFYTAVAVLDTGSGALLQHLDATRVQVRTLSDGEIVRYLQREQPYDCAGSFKVEGLGISLFAKVVSDDPTALIGLPLIALAAMLRQCGLAVP